MGTTESALARARAASEARRHAYGFSPPRSIERILDGGPERCGVFGRFRVWWYVQGGGLYLHLRSLCQILADRDTPKRQKHIANLTAELSQRLSPGCRVIQGPFERNLYSRDLAPVPSWIEKLLFRTSPLLVAQPVSAGNVTVPLEFAVAHALSVYPRGIASSPLGGCVPTRNGLVLDLSRMDQILALDSARETVTLQPGVRWAKLTSHLEPLGWAPVTVPSSLFSTVAGWVATGGLGLHGYKYGHLRDSVVACRVAVPNGQTLVLREPCEILDFIGTEGQLGVVTELELRVRRVPEIADSVLLTFADASQAFQFVETLTAAEITPSHVAFFDRHRLAEENRLFSDRTGHPDPVVPELDGLLLHLDDPSAAASLGALLSESPTVRPVDGPAARYLWAERFFPLKGQRLGPNLVAAECLLPPSAVAGFLQQARKLARRFGVTLATEAVVSRVDGRLTATVIASFPADKRRTLEYLCRLLLAGLLMRLGLRHGGQPYGLGIWNTVFADHHFSKERWDHLRRRKRELDPGGTLNPGKFFELRTRFRNLPGRLMVPSWVQRALGLAARLATPLGMLAKIAAPAPQQKWNVPNPEDGDGSALLTQTAQRCTHCGACVSVCPAYLLTGDELVTARAKLQLSDALFRDAVVREDEAFRPFQCLRCGLCEEVCQTRLPLRACYEKLEEQVVRYCGSYPTELVQEFIARVDERRDWVEQTFGLDLADWAPAKLTPRLPGSRIPPEQRG